MLVLYFYENFPIKFEQQPILKWNLIVWYEIILRKDSRFFSFTEIYQSYFVFAAPLSFDKDTCLNV